MNQKRQWIGGAQVLLIVVLAGCNPAPRQAEQTPASAASHEHQAESSDMEGFAIALVPTQGSSVSGAMMLMSMDGAGGEGMHFSGVISGLSPGKHALHVHEQGDCSAADGSSASGHFNPSASPHGAPEAVVHHAGDLGNIEAGADGRAEVNIHASGLSLKGAANSVTGRALIVHAAADDFTTQPAGNAGARLACGVIQAAN